MERNDIVKKFVLPLTIIIMLLCACSNQPGTLHEQSQPLVSEDSQSLRSSPEVTTPATGGEENSSVTTTAESKTEASSNETTTTTEPTTISTAPSTTVTTTSNPASEKSTEPPQTVPPKSEPEVSKNTDETTAPQNNNEPDASIDEEVIVYSSASDYINEQFTDYFIYGRVYYINVSKDPSWNRNEYIAADELMEITSVSDIRVISQLSDGTSSILPVGTKIYKCENRNDILLVYIDGEFVPYLMMVEG